MLEVSPAAIKKWSPRARMETAANGSDVCRQIRRDPVIRRVP